jgi:hypothetical protein
MTLTLYRIRLPAGTAEVVPLILNTGFAREQVAAGAATM